MLPLFKKGDKIRIKDEDINIMLQAGMNFQNFEGTVYEVMEETKGLDDNDQPETHQLLVIEIDGVLDENGVERKHILLYNGEVEPIAKEMIS